MDRFTIGEGGGPSRGGRTAAFTASTSECRCAASGPLALRRGGAPLGASLFIGLEPRLDLARHGLVPLPQRFRPSPLNLIYRPLSARAPKTLDPAAVSLSFLDFDPY